MDGVLHSFSFVVMFFFMVKRKYPLCMCLFIKVTCMPVRPRIYCWYNGNLNSVTQFFLRNLTNDSKKNVAVTYKKMLPNTAKIVTHGLFWFLPLLCHLFSPFHELLWVFRSAALDCWRGYQRLSALGVICWERFDVDVACFFFLPPGSAWVSLVSLLICFYSSFFSSLV